MIPTITPYYAAALTLLFLVLSLRVIGQRRSARVSLGDAGDAGLQARIRAHGNCAEYAPLGLVLLLLAELTGAPALALHLAGLALLLGRILHALALGAKGGMGLRVAGMALTFAALTGSALLAII